MRLGFIRSLGQITHIYSVPQFVSSSSVVLVGLKGFRNGDGYGESSHLSRDNIMKKMCQVRSPQRIYGPHFQAEMDAISVTAHVISGTEGRVLLNFTVMLLLK